MNPSDPYCGECGYALTGLVDSSRCPECGRPIVEVLQRRSDAPVRARRHESSTKIWGWPLVSIATGPVEGETRGHAKGIIAIGDVATGVLALGGVSRGVFAMGGIAIGLFAIGGLSLGLLMSLAGVALGGLSTGGVAVGLWVQGGVAIGLIADGGVALGWFTRGGVTGGTHYINGSGATRGAMEIIKQWGWLIGTTWPTVIKWSLLSSLGLLIVTVAGVLAGYVFGDQRGKPEDA